MVDIYEFKKRVARKKREATKDFGFIVRDCRDSFYVMDDEYLNGYSGICGLAANSVYMLLCRHVGKEQVCYPSNAYMAKKLMTSEPTIRKAIRVLETHRIIKVDRIQGQPNIYTLTSKRVWRKTAPVISESDLAQPKTNFSAICGECRNNGNSEICIGCQAGTKWEQEEKHEQSNEGS